MYFRYYSCWFVCSSLVRSVYKSRATIAHINDPDISYVFGIVDRYENRVRYSLVQVVENAPVKIARQPINEENNILDSVNIVVYFIN